MKNIAVVVTYNRCGLLQKNIMALKSQTHPLDTILIINNGSTDGTKEWLDTQEGITVITQKNIGGSGGFWRGIKEAYLMGADYIWCMDDDVHPFADCLEKLLEVMPDEGGIVAPKRLWDGKSVVCDGECLHFNFSNPLKALKNDSTLESINKAPEKLEVEAISFEGPLISRNVVEQIGFPEKDLFIFWDDTEYSYRAFRNGFKVLYASKALLYKENLMSKGIKMESRSWKYPYMIRNEVFFIQKYSPFAFGKIKELMLYLKYCMGIFKHLILFDKKYRFADFRIMNKAFWGGVRGKLGKI